MTRTCAYCGGEPSHRMVQDTDDRGTTRLYPICRGCDRFEAVRLCAECGCAIDDPTSQKCRRCRGRRSTTAAACG